MRISPPPSRVLVAAAAAAFLAACEHRPSDLGPGRLPLGLRPSFSISPSSPPDSTECTEGVAYESTYPSDVSLDSAKFYPPGSSQARTQCGDLAFDESEGSPGSVKLKTVLQGTGAPVQSWSRGTRGTTSDTLSEAFQTLWLDTTKMNTYDAPANDKYDLVAFAYRHGSDSAMAVRESTDVTALAQLWRHIDTVTSFNATSQGYWANLSWANHHRNRNIDSTEVWRRSSSGSWTLIATKVHSATSHSDSAGPGTWYYLVRHVSAGPDYPNNDVGVMARPKTRTTAEKSVSIYTPAPTYLMCEGNFQPTMDCVWSAGSPTATTRIFRNNDSVATVAAGVTSWTDQSVDTGTTYVYKLRHVENGVLSAFSAPDTAVARPVPPSGLSCAGTTDTEDTCIWDEEESDTVQVWRRVGNHGSYSLLALVVPGQGWYVDSPVETGTVYWYKVRYRRGSALSEFSNADDAHPGEGDPLRPGGP